LDYSTYRTAWTPTGPGLGQHAGQAQPSVDAFLKLRPEEADALLKFLQAL
jgi:hypothetical protein